MKFISTIKTSPAVTLEEAVRRGLAPDGGIYLPEKIDTLPPVFFNTLPQRTFLDVCCEVANHLLGESLSMRDTERIVHEAITFEAPLRTVSSNLFALELYHGPTYAFKDFGARFMAKLLGHFAAHSGTQTTVLVATSGDTGGAVASGFFKTEGVDVIILYPSGRVSPLQEMQLTGWGENISALEVEGSFDDCQALVKQAFLDPELSNLTSANSINIARLIPQSFYYYSAHAQLDAPRSGAVYSVPSGNFGNLTAGVIAHKTGLPVKRFIAATNKNDTVPAYLQSGQYRPKPSVQTISNAMDVGNPNNFPRLATLLGDSVLNFREILSGYSFSDDQTRDALRELFSLYGCICDPHAAVAYLGVKKYRTEEPNDSLAVFLETAHPAKFTEVVEPTLEREVPLPPALQEFLGRPRRSTKMSTNYSDLKEMLLRRG